MNTSVSVKYEIIESLYEDIPTIFSLSIRVHHKATNSLEGKPYAAWDNRIARTTYSSKSMVDEVNLLFPRLRAVGVSVDTIKTLIDHIWRRNPLKLRVLS